MKRRPLDSLEYESTYLELRPSRDRVMTVTGKYPGKRECDSTSA